MKHSLYLGDGCTPETIDPSPHQLEMGRLKTVTVGYSWQIIPMLLLIIASLRVDTNQRVEDTSMSQ